MIKFFLMVLIAVTVLNAQKADPETVIKRVESKFNQVKDYEVKVNVKVDVEFMKVPESNAIIYYKQPDKINIESEGFALLPKEGLNFTPLSLIKGDYSALYEKGDNFNGRDVHIIKIIPLGNEGEIILSTFTIDKEKDLVLKVETTTKASGSFVIEFDYKGGNEDYHLPGSMVFSFNSDKMKLPGMMGEPAEKKSKAKDRITTGKVTVKYSEYKVNKGIPDSMFKSKD
jgi:hypothetical protein